MRWDWVLLGLTACAPQATTPSATAAGSPQRTADSPQRAADGPASSPAFADSPPPPVRFASRTLGETEASGAGRWSGRAIDLDLKGADIHDVCRLIADVGKVNIVVSDDVTGSVTVKMRGVPWDQALDVIVRAKGSVAERDGRMIFVTRAR